MPPSPEIEIGFEFAFGAPSRLFECLQQSAIPRPISLAFSIREVSVVVPPSKPRAPPQIPRKSLPPSRLDTLGPMLRMRPIAILALLSALLPTFASGCATARADPATRTLTIFDGHSGEAMVWTDVIDRAAAADGTFIGERHDDPTAHAVQLAVFQDLLARAPGTAIALEHLERDEQSTLDRYLRGEMTPDAFIDATKSRDWAGKDTWVFFFQPLVDTAREHHAPVIAANAPRDIVRRARSEGHDALDKLPPPERATFDIPIQTTADPQWNAAWKAYQERFHEFATSGDDDPNSAEARARTSSVFLSQSMWDATMGASAAAGGASAAAGGASAAAGGASAAAGAKKVVVCAGCFHIERDGGTVLQFRARRPGARTLTISVFDESSPRLRSEDRDAADIVIYGVPVKRAAVDNG